MITDEKVKPSSLKIFSQEHFENFSTNHSWEPGWLVDLRKESWEKLKSIDENDLKNEGWRFSPRNRFGYSHFKNIVDSSDSPKFNQSSENPDIICDSVDNILLKRPDLVSCFTDAKGPNLGAVQTYQLINTYFDNGFLSKFPRNLMRI